MVFVRAPENGENGAHIDIGVNIGRSVQGIENQQIFSLLITIRNTDDVGIFLGGHAAKHPSALHAVDDRVIGQFVQLLHGKRQPGPDFGIQLFFTVEVDRHVQQRA